jgi:glycosyltransferase involved in cell wall biosynthesis
VAENEERHGRPELSLVIVNYNYADFLPQAIDSALAQSIGSCEVIVVDDCSTDGSRAVIEAYGDRITPVYRAVNGGMSAAVNSGFARSSGRSCCSSTRMISYTARGADDPRCL